MDDNTYGDIDDVENFVDGWFSVDLFSDHLRSSSSFADFPAMPQMQTSLSALSAGATSVSQQRNLLRIDEAQEARIRDRPYHMHENSPLDLVEFGSDEGSDYDDVSFQTGDASKVGAKRMMKTEATVNDDDDESSEEEDGSVAQSKIRAKNREHAKNTRIRKKNYIETLKEHVRLLAEERERIDRDRRVALSRVAEQTTVRKSVLQTFFHYRASAEMSRSKWATILDESVCLTLPLTPYRSFPPSEVVNGQRIVSGIDALITDTASLGVLVQSIGKNHMDTVKVNFHCGDEDIAITGDHLICRWVMWTENAVDCGALHECNKHGMLRARFSAQNRLVRIEQVFDVMAFMQQLRRASGSADFQVIPNTLETAMEKTDEARLITSGTRPFEIVHINEPWTKLCGFTEEELKGKTCKVLQGPESDIGAASKLMNDVMLKRPHSSVLTNYSRKGEKMKQFVSVFPLYTKDQHEVSNFVSVSDTIDESMQFQRRIDRHENESMFSGRTTLDEFLSQNGSRYGEKFDSTCYSGSSDDKSERSSDDMIQFLSR